MFDSAGSKEEGLSQENALHIGRVVFNEDPDRQQRIKVFIPGIMEDDIDRLPWIGPVAQSPFGLSNTHGTVSVPVIDSLVIIDFQGGDKNHGLYNGCVATAALGVAMPTELSTNYPNRYGFFDPKGNKFFMDLTSGETTFIHNSGTTIQLLANGTGTMSFVGAVTGTAPSWTFNGPLTWNGATQFNGNSQVVGNQNVTSQITSPVIDAQTSLSVQGNDVLSHYHITQGLNSPTSAMQG